MPVNFFICLVTWKMDDVRNENALWIIVCVRMLMDGICCNFLISVAHKFGSFSCSVKA